MPRRLISVDSVFLSLARIRSRNTVRKYIASTICRRIGTRLQSCRRR